ncbi:hypothetical protein CD36_04340 [Candida dubliniensis CD36]|uniref:Uncharacterized protein n=1 Tax=Candida dubliniensis (strain CD36 / ATCC MYA-646 / CBS 7987 / NCPF 3949 / NRRL Y-17841) TaxID=573826 RepID=B9W7N3_CANDC|nr:hypothetical protein CD36_04340 [Candida dubliniensis CD36]CAX44694.1 hypothetical protein CD36_04340 [Candida dubliniensis CD36]
MRCELPPQMIFLHKTRFLVCKTTDESRQHSFISNITTTTATTITWMTMLNLTEIYIHSIMAFDNVFILFRFILLTCFIFFSFVSRRGDVQCEGEVITDFVITT